MPVYRHETYDYGPTFTLADLIAEPARVRAAALAGQGRIGAEAERTRGELSARAARDIGMIGAQKWSTLGQLAGNTLQNIGQYYADKPRREAEARRAEYEQLELTEKKRQTGMQEAARMILSAPGMMVQDQQTGVKMFDKGKLSQELQAARLDPSVIAEALKTAEALDGHAAEFVAGRRHGIAGFAFEVLQAGSTPASVLGAVKSGVENGLFTQRDVQPFLKQIDEQGPEAIFPIMRRLTIGSAYEEQASKILSPADARSRRTREQLDLMKAESELQPKPSADFTLTPGARRFGPSGQEIARVPLPPAHAPDLTPNAALGSTLQLRDRFVRETQAARTVKTQYDLMKASLQAVKSGAAPPGSQGVLVTFQKILDPTSVVRESEYARSASGLSLLSRMEGTWQTIQKGGAGVPVKDLEDFVSLAEQFVRNQARAANVTKTQIEGIAREFGLKPENITQELGLEGEALADVPDLTGLTPGKGARFTTGPFAGQTWTIGPDGKPKRVR